MITVERPAFDLGPGRVGAEPPIDYPAGGPLAPPRRAEEAEIGADEVGRPTQQRGRKPGAAHPGAGELRLEIAGEEPLGPVVVAGEIRNESPLEEGARLIIRRCP